MAHYNYVIVGAGMTGDAAVKGIRSIDPKGSIALIGSEKEKPYDRPLLSKKLWKGEPFEKIWRHTPEKDLHFYLGRSVTNISPQAKRVQLDQKEEISYDKLLLATGGTVRRLLAMPKGIIYF